MNSANVSATSTSRRSVIGRCVLALLLVTSATACGSGDGDGTGQDQVPTDSASADDDELVEESVPAATDDDGGNAPTDPDDGASSAGEAALTELEDAPFVHDVSGYSILRPAGWLTETFPDDARTLFRVTGDQAAVINIRVAYDDADLSIEGYRDEARAIATNEFPDYELDDDRLLTINGNEAYLISDVYTSAALDNRTVANQQVGVLANGKLYIITFATPVEHWDTYEGMFEAIYTSFTAI